MTDPDPQGRAKGLGIFVTLISGKGDCVNAPAVDVDGTVHVGTVMVSLELVVTVPAPNVKALPVQLTRLFSVMAFVLAIIVPKKLVFAARVVIPFGVQNTSQADAPLVNVILSATVVLSAPFILKI